MSAMEQKRHEVSYGLELPPLADFTTSVVDKVLIAAKVGQQSTSYQRIPATSGTDLGVKFNIASLANSQILSKNIFISMRVQVELDCTVNPTPAAQSTWCVRSFPVYRLMQSGMRITLNGQQVHVPAERIAEALVNATDLRDNEIYSLAYAQPDLIGGAMPEYKDAIDSNKSPMHRTGASEVWDGRRVGVTAVYAANRSTITFDTMFPIPCGLFDATNTSAGFCDLRSLEVQFDLSSDAARCFTSLMVAADPGGGGVFSAHYGVAGGRTAAITGARVSLARTPEMIVQVATLHPEILATLRDSNGVFSTPIITPYMDNVFIDGHQTQIPVLAAGAPGRATLQINNQFRALPKKLYIYARRVKTGMTLDDQLQTSDALAVIDKLTIELANSGKSLGSLDSDSLYSLSVRNGGLKNVTVHSWRKAGSLVCIDVSQDLNIGRAIIGEPGNWQINIEAECLNYSTGHNQYQLVACGQIPMLFVQSEGRCELFSPSQYRSPDEAFKQELFMSAQPEAARVIGGADFSDQSARGAGFFGDLWRGIKKVGSTVGNAALSALPALAPLAVKTLTGGESGRIVGGASVNLQGVSGGGRGANKQNPYLGFR